MFDLIICTEVPFVEVSRWWVKVWSVPAFFQSPLLGEFSFGPILCVRCKGSLVQTKLLQIFPSEKCPKEVAHFQSISFCILAQFYEKLQHIFPKGLAKKYVWMVWNIAKKETPAADVELGDSQFFKPIMWKWKAMTQTKAMMNIISMTWSHQGTAF